MIQSLHFLTLTGTYPNFYDANPIIMTLTLIFVTLSYFYDAHPDYHDTNPVFYDTDTQSCMDVRLSNKLLGRQACSLVHGGACWVS
jgi:hypothetical protein